MMLQVCVVSEQQILKIKRIKKDKLVFTGSFIDFLAHLVTTACYRVTAYFANIPFVKVCIYNGINDYIAQ